MQMITDYFKRVGWRRMIVMILGNMFIGMGVAIFKMSGMGTDPFSGMVMAMSDCVGIPYAIFIVMFNVLIFMLEFFFGRELIGIGTICAVVMFTVVLPAILYLWYPFVVRFSARRKPEEAADEQTQQ